MRLTKNKAIQISIELWTWLAETGGSDKGDWVGWEKYGEIYYNCALCEYGTLVGSIVSRCFHCPYYLKFGKCYKEGQPFLKWGKARIPKTRKKYAALFLAQLMEL